jgi:hypothetical protein
MNFDGFGPVPLQSRGRRKPYCRGSTFEHLGGLHRTLETAPRGHENQRFPRARGARSRSSRARGLWARSVQNHTFSNNFRDPDRPPSLGGSRPAPQNVAEGLGGGSPQGEEACLRARPGQKLYVFTGLPDLDRPPPLGATQDKSGLSELSTDDVFRQPDLLVATTCDSRQTMSAMSVSLRLAKKQARANMATDKMHFVVKFDTTPLPANQPLNTYQITK